MFLGEPSELNLHPADIEFQLILWLLGEQGKNYCTLSHGPMPEVVIGILKHQTRRMGAMHTPCNELSQCLWNLHLMGKTAGIPISTP
jgi:hypothetical protein